MQNTKHSQMCPNWGTLPYQFKSGMHIQSATVDCVKVNSPKSQFAPSLNYFLEKILKMITFK